MTEKNWGTDIVGKLASAIKARHHSDKASLDQAVRDLERDVARGNRAAHFLTLDIWTQDIAQFLDEREAVADIPAYRPGEDESVRQDIDMRRAYVSGMRQVRENLKQELNSWVESGRQAAAKLKLLREAEKPKPSSVAGFPA